MNSATMHVSMELWGTIFCVMGAICVAAGLDGGDSFEKQPKRIAVVKVLCISALVALSDAVTWMYEGDTTDIARVLMVVSSYANFIMGFFLYAAVSDYAACCIAPKAKGFKEKPLWCKIIYLLAFAGIILATVNLFYPYIYRITETNVFQVLDGYMITQLLLLVGAGIESIVVAVSYKLLSSEEMIGVFGFTILSFAVLLYQIFASDSELVNLSLILSALFLFTLYEMDQAKKGMLRKKELEESEMKLMMSQVQPHFIYNCLAALRFLIMDDQEKAYQAINDFSRYLRMNLDTTKLNRMITLKEELANVECYYNLEKLQLEDKIDLIYDLIDINMMLPAMTIQPMVENAIKHGIKPKGGGILRICQYEEEESWQLLIEDDGVGFELDKMYSDEREHIGVANVRGRIEKMCGGTLEIMSKPGRGTQVYIIIPKDIRDGEQN